MRKRLFAAFICLCMIVSLMPSVAFAGSADSTIYTGGLCEHHTVHDSTCGYSEWAAEVPCSHEHTEECYVTTENCIHTHTDECYSDGSTEPDICSHVCSEDLGCIVKELNCNHEHDEVCGYVPEREGTPCTYVCEICNAPVTEEQKCICETKCTEEEINESCPVCGENGDISACIGTEKAEEQKCICETKCTEGKINEICPVCGGENGDISACIGAEKAEETKCICETKCTEEEVNKDCPICGENGNIDACMGAAMMLTLKGARSITATQPTNGDGSLNNPYEITNASELYWFAAQVNSGAMDACAKLMNDIVIQENVLNADGSLNSGTFEKWTPIGNNYFNEYYDTFDGNGHTISGLYVDSNVRYVGLFGQVGYGGRIKNVGVVDSYISGNSWVGGVCGNSNGTIENCYNTGTVSGSSSGISFISYVGGVCGYNLFVGTIENCYNTGKVTGIDAECVGGVCGENRNTITNCYNTGKVTGTNTQYVGGICGNNLGNVTITNCYFLTGTAEIGIDRVDGTVTRVEEKTSGQFTSGEVAWLLNSASEGTWVQDMLHTMPVLKDNLPVGVSVSDCKKPVRITIKMSDAISQYDYTTEGSILTTYPNGYVFFEDEGYTSLIDKSSKTYTVDTIIYAAKAVESITLNKTELSLYVGGEEKLTATVEPDNAGDKSLTWSSSDNTVVTVDQNGNIKALKAGTATITAEAVDGSGVKAECVVTVKKKSSSGGGSPSYYFVTFNTNGGDDMDKLFKVENTDIDIDEYIPEKEGYEFAGWYLDENIEEKAKDMKLTKDITIYAKWEKVEEEEIKEDIEDIKETEETEETTGVEIHFVDVRKGDWFYDAVCYTVEHGIMSGVSNDFFAPGMPFTREMLAVVLYNMEGRPEINGISAFADVKSDMWYTDAIIWANENSIVAGYDNGTYGVGDTITREQFAAILYRYAVFKGYDTTQGGMAVREFLDYEKISDYAKPAVSWAVNTGIINGMGDGTVAPQGKATRAEAATMIMNFYEKVI